MKKMLTIIKNAEINPSLANNQQDVLHVSLKSLLGKKLMPNGILYPKKGTEDS